MFCVRCGTQNQAGAQYCSNCGNPLAGQASPVAGEGPVAQDPATSALQAPFEYAGFWRRFVAYIIDSILIGIFWSPVQNLLMTRFGFDPAEIEAMSPEQFSNPEALMELFSVVGLIALIGLGVQWLYFGLMESSAKQATVGKMALGMKVTDEYGERVTFARATGRYLAKFVSAIIFMIGYIMAAFTERKQALHDKIAHTLVVRARD